jgi:hypothetical protein
MTTLFAGSRDVWRYRVLDGGLCYYMYMTDWFRTELGYSINRDIRTAKLFNDDSRSRDSVTPAVLLWYSTFAQLSHKSGEVHTLDLKTSYELLSPVTGISRVAKGPAISKCTHHYLVRKESSRQNHDIRSRDVLEFSSR